MPAVVSLLVALAVSLFLVKRFGAAPAHGRFASIDGLRGYLAFFVFLHHAAIWYFYQRTGEWKAPPSNLYVHFGQSSVALFFMITGFLFFSKILEGKKKPVDWGRLFVSRALRLLPLYSFAILLMLFVVAYQSNGVLVEPIQKLLIGIAKWLGFTIFGTPDINGVKHTSLIVALVTWSLPYEVFFYLALPLFSLMTTSVPPMRYIALSIVSFIALSRWHPDTYHLASFLGGIAGSFLVRSKKFCDFSEKRVASVVILISIFSVIAIYPSTYDFSALLLLSIAFVLIAGGNSLFGALTNPASRTLGEMAFSIYMLHGIVLYVAFKLMLGMPRAIAFSPVEHWLFVAALSVVLVLLSFTTFRLIERPAMRSAPSVTAWLRSRQKNREPKASDLLRDPQ